MIENYKPPLYCPHCNRGEVYSTEYADILISTICPVCGKGFLIDLLDGETYRRQDLPFLKREDLPPPYKIPCPCPNCNAETWVYGTAAVRISIQCWKKTCHQYYIADLMSMTSYASVPIRKPERRKQSHTL